jgi:DNA polymerase-3 subunit delta
MRDFQSIVNEIDKKIYYPVYFLFGDESFYIDRITKKLEATVLDENEKGFNQQVLYGKDVTEDQIASTARQYPAAAPYRVIIIREAQDLKNIEKLEHYFGKPVETTILVFNYKYKKVDKRKRYFKNIEKYGLPFESKKIYDNQIPAWIEKYLNEQGYSITGKSAMLLSEHLGNDLNKIAREIDKMKINLGDRKNITAEDIEKNIGLSKDYNIFELQDAISIRDFSKAIRIIQYFNANKKDYPAVKVIPLLYYFFQKLFTIHFLKNHSENNVAASLNIHPFIAKKYIQAAKNYPPKKLSAIMNHLRVYDLRSKGYKNLNTSDGELLKELIYKIMH